MVKKFKILCLVLALSMLTSMANVFAYSDVYEYDSYQLAVSRLESLGILNGYTDGTFRPTDTLTRAQFAKIVVCAMDKEDEAIATGTTSSFYDVPKDYWATPYINYVSKNNVIIGYSDGSFNPEKSISYAEALTVLIRMLGYTESDVGYYWPNNYMDKAKSLKITDNFNSVAPNDNINRAVAAVLTDATLFTNIKNTSTAPSSATDKTFLQTGDYTVLKDQIVLLTSEEDSSLPPKNIKLSNNSIYEYKTNDDFKSAAVLKYVVIDKDNFIVAVKDNLQGSVAVSEMNTLGYTVLNNCHIIASASQDKSLASSEIRTSKGVYTAQDSSIASSVGEVGTVILSKDKKIISAGTHDAPYQEYIVSEVNNSSIEYVTNNELAKLDISPNFPVYVDSGAVKNFSDVVTNFVSGAELTMYKSADNGDYEFGVLDTNAGYSILNDCFIVATKAEDKSLASDQVRTSNGVYKVKSTDVLAKAGTMGTVVTNSGGKIEQFAPTDMQSLNVVVNSINNDQMEYITTDGIKGIYKFENTFVLYSDYVKSTYSMSKSNIKAGTGITLYGTTSGEWEFAVIDTTSDIDPVLATKNYSDSDTSIEGIEINKNNLIVYRAGEASRLSEIQRNDVVYYNTKTNIIDVYTKKVTGIYYEATPSKAYITSVTVGGNNYQIGTTNATSKLDASVGSYAIGDKVTLLLGKNDEVVFVVELSDFDYFDYGVVVNTKTSIKDSGDNLGKSEIKAKVFMADGNVYEYVTERDYSMYKGMLVKLIYNNGVISMSSATSSNRIYGDVNKANRTIGEKQLLKDASIIQLVSNIDGQDAQVQLLNFDNLSVSSIFSGQVLNTITANKFGDIGIMYVNGLTNDDYSYPMLVGVTSNANSATYKILENGTTKTYQSTTRYSVTSGTPIGLKTSNGQITSVMNLYTLRVSNQVDAIEGGRVMIDGNIFKMTPDVVIYSYKNGDYSQITIDDLEKLSTNSVSIFSDKSLSDNGMVRVILVTPKQ